MAGEQSPGGWGGDDEESMSRLGFRFKPTLRELVEFYLLPKLLDKPTVANHVVIEADAYECDPEILTKKYEERGADDNWYFLSPRSRRYPGGDRPSRRTADDRGRWKPSTGQSKPGKNPAAGRKKGTRKNLRVGAVEFTENTLAYYVGEPKNETKTKWLMHELTVPEAEKDKDPDAAATSEKPRGSMLLNKYVMCRIYKSPLKKWREPEDGEGSTSSAAAACGEEVPASSQSVPAPESVEKTVAPTPSSSKRAGKRPAVEQPGAPNKRAFRQTMPPPPAPPGPTMHANGGGGGTRVPVGAGGAGYYHGVPGLPPLVQWPPVMYKSLQGPVQLQWPPAMHNGVQGSMQPQRPPAMYNIVQGSGQPPAMYNIVQGSGQPPAMYNSVQEPVQPQRPPAMYNGVQGSGQPPAMYNIMQGSGQSPAMYNSVQEPVQPQRPPAAYNSVQGSGQPQLSPAMYNSVQGSGQPPAMYNSVQGPVQPQWPRAMHEHDGQALVQEPPGLRLFPPQSLPRQTLLVPNSLGRTTMTRPQDPEAEQSARPPSLPRPPRQHHIQHQQRQMESTKTELEVYAQLAAEIKRQKALQAQESASCAGQQQIQPTAASTQPTSSDEGAAANHPAGAEVMVPCPQFPAPDNCYPCSAAQQQQHQQEQQSGPAIPETSAAPGAAAPPVETTTPTADNDAHSELSVPRVASEGSGKGNCYDYSKPVSGDSSEGSVKGSYYNYNSNNFFADFLAAMQN